MSSYRIVGLESILHGAVNTTTYAIPASTLTTLSETVPGSAKIVFEAPESTKLYVEESDDVDVEIQGAKTKRLEFATRDMGFDNFILGLGGSTSGTLYSAPTTSTTAIQKAFRVTTKPWGGVQYQIDIPNGSVMMNGELQFTKTETGQLGFSVSVLKAGTTSPFRVRRI